MNSIGADFFDTLHNRYDTDSIKYGRHPEFKSKTDLIPLWIADMDFKVPPAVEKALINTAEHGIFGYTEVGGDYDAIVASWYRRRMGWNIMPEWILKTPGVIFAVSAALHALTAPGDSVLICQPVYYPFANIISANDRKLIVSELKFDSVKYQIDFADFEQKIKSENVKIFLLCSPHNPVGRVWTMEELAEIGRICCKYDVHIISDEIHSDFIFPGMRHIPMASISPELSDRTITCTAPSKTFNLAGLQASNIIISNSSIRRKIRKACAATGYGGLNTMAVAAVKAAYLHGEDWLNALLSYLQGNITLLRDTCRSSGKISLVEPEGTYLMWLDCRKMGMSDRKLEEFFINQAGVWLHKGVTFGEGGSGFMRMNIACPRSVLLKALEQILAAIDEHK